MIFDRTARHAGAFFRGFLGMIMARCLGVAAVCVCVASGPDERAKGPAVAGSATARGGSDAHLAVLAGRAPVQH